jgi:hypothetical protein
MSDHDIDREAIKAQRQCSLGHQVGDPWRSWAGSQVCGECGRVVEYDGKETVDEMRSGGGA